ncbi:XkdQ/YqbQ family protein [Cohnella thailandensis]|uniref:YqbQ/XkdQ domain-containing protein n=1 Tax=Cohnella thailandensis TaxID=557557 RepID=A0A841SRR1_9BACL|nr:hypothetical protein [Cohnella thailandensis]MBB6632755.1 hypothetical protein [Cohnella thailandensis]MBP1975556.1 hypothetical protein [Cohnella thailandensis]
MLEVVVVNKNGRVWDVSTISGKLSWTTTRVGKPASIEFTMISSGVYQDPSFSIANGDVVRVRMNEVNVFYGYVFKLKQNQDGEISVTAYDQIRYLLNKDTYVFKDVETGDVIKQIAADFKLKVGTIDSTGYRIPSLVRDGQTLIDIIEEANTKTISNAGQFFVFFDDFGALSLRRVSQFLAGFYVGDGSLLTGFDYAEDIDSDTYNQIKLYKDNKETGKREIYQAQDSVNIAKWGVLQLYQSVDENMNAAQINQMLTQLASLKNREQRSLKLEAIGDISVRAGMYLPIMIQALGINQPMLVDEVKHSFDGEHTMSITLKVI